MNIQAFDYSLNLLRALLWQHNEASRLESLIASKQAWYDTNHSQFWSDWVRDVFDLRTANDFGLSVWAAILDIPLAITTPPDPAGKAVYGFGSYYKNFTRGTFASISNSNLTTEQRRLVLRLRYFQLVTTGAVPEINEFLGKLFADMGPVYVLDNLDMTATYVFGFALPSELQQVLTEYDVLPRPAGVAVDFVVLVAGDGFGFGRYHTNYDNGNYHHA